MTTIPGKPIRVQKWIHGRLCVLNVAVDAILPDFEPREPMLEPPAIRLLDSLQRLADAGDVEELEKHGTVYVRKSA